MYVNHDSTVTAAGLLMYFLGEFQGIKIAQLSQFPGGKWTSSLSQANMFHGSLALRNRVFPFSEPGDDGVLVQDQNQPPVVDTPLC